MPSRGISVGSRRDAPAFPGERRRFTRLNDEGSGWLRQKAASICPQQTCFSSAPTVSLLTSWPLRRTIRLTSATAEGSSLESQLAAVNAEYDAAGRRIAELEGEKGVLEAELAEIKRTAANVLSICDQNKQLQVQLASAEIEAATLEQQNRELTSQTTRYWFMTGALVLLVGMILGIWLLQIRWQRCSRYDRF